MIIGSEEWKEGEVTIVESHAKEWVKEEKTFTYDELIDLFDDESIVGVLAQRCKLMEEAIQTFSKWKERRA